MADGSRHSMHYIKETVYGTTPASPAFKAIRHTGTTLALAKDSLQSEEIRADRQIADFRHGAIRTEGEISVELSFNSFDDLLEAVAMGTWATGTLKAGTARTSFTIERKFSDLSAAQKPYQRFTGVEFNSLQLSVGANAIVKATFGVIGSDMKVDGAIVTGATYANPTTTVPLDSFTGVLKENGATIAVVTEISLELQNGLEPRYVVGNKKSIRPAVGRSNVTGTLTAYFEDSTLLEKFINETESSLEFELPDGAGNKYTFTIPRLKYSGGQPDVQGEGPVTIALPFQGLLDAVSGTNFQVKKVPTT